MKSGQAAKWTACIFRWEELSKNEGGLYTAPHDLPDFVPLESAGIHKTCHPDFFSVTQAKLASPVGCSPPKYAMLRRTPWIWTGLFH